MVTRQELIDNHIVEWNTVKQLYDHPLLLLGNGFSMMLSAKFSYPSLFDIFLSKCNPQNQELFSQFDTTNFELIQKYLLYARKVNSILNLSTTEIDAALSGLKNGLIEAIETVHPRVIDIDMNQLKSVARQLEYFGDIFTTNYDLYLYHIIMLSKDLSIADNNYVPYQDWFWGNQAPAGFKQFMNYQNLRYKNLFYLHGSLFIFNHGVMNIKILRGNHGDELIELISNEILHDHFPVFVSEGSSQHKIETINNSNYLVFCHVTLKRTNGPIVIFGNSLGEFDNHILDAIKEHDRPIIYCLYPGNRTLAELNVERYTFLSKFNNYRSDITIVDASTVFAI